MLSLCCCNRDDSNEMNQESTPLLSPISSSTPQQSLKVPVYFVQNIRNHDWCVLRILFDDVKKIKKLMSKHKIRFKMIKDDKYMFFIVYMNFIHLNQLFGHILSACDDYPLSLHTYV